MKVMMMSKLDELMIGRLIVGGLLSYEENVSVQNPHTHMDLGHDN